MNDSRYPAPTRKQLALGCAIFALLGAATMVYLHGSGVGSGTKYHGDLSQSPHWIAYHGDRFAGDDLLVRYATFNETTLQNAIYWVGTWFVDVAALNKIVGIVIFGMTAALFFLVVSSTAGVRAGVLAALFFLIFPRSAYETAGGFSKAWSIGLVLTAVHVVETRSWRLLPWIMPFAALAYPVAPVLIGAIAAVGIALELAESRAEAFRGLKYLIVGSVVGIIPLLYKYLSPPEEIGEMVSTDVMRSMWEQRLNNEPTIPLWQEVLTYVSHPFFVDGAAALLILLYRRGIVWKRSWSALVIASGSCYFVADFVIPRLYLPDRYTRYSMAVLLVLCFAHNWSRVLDTIRNRWAHAVVAAALVVMAGVAFSDTFRPCDGTKSLGRWEDKEYAAEVSAALADEPSPVLVAGHPYVLADVLVQARQPVLVIHRMFHSWFVGYRRSIDTRVRNTVRAIYAGDPGPVNYLAERYGVTHLVIRKSHYRNSLLQSGKFYKHQYRKLVRRLARESESFVLNPPPPSSVLYEDEKFWVVRLPPRLIDAVQGM